MYFHCRWMIRADVPSVVAIGEEVFGPGFTEDGVYTWLRQRCIIGMAVEDRNDSGDDGPIVGFMIYELFESKLELLRFATARSYQRQGVGRVMCNTLKSKLAAHDRTRIGLWISERDLAGQLFFRSQDFRATGAIRSEEEGDEYRMAYHQPRVFLLENVMRAMSSGR